MLLLIISGIKIIDLFNNKFGFNDNYWNCSRFNSICIYFAKYKIIFVLIISIYNKYKQIYNKSWGYPDAQEITFQIWVLVFFFFLLKLLLGIFGEVQGEVQVYQN